MRGLEQTSESSGNGEIDPQGGAESGASDAAIELSDPDLQVIVDRWPQLSDEMKAGIIAMVRAAGTKA